MARRQQTELDFRGADFDAASSFRAAMNAAREKLNRIPLAATGLSPLRWNQTKELIMAIIAHERAGLGRGANTQPALEAVMRTSGLTRDQAYRARQQALGLGLIQCSRRYRSRDREPDTFSADLEAIERLALLKRGPPCEQVLTGANRCEQVLTGANSSRRGSNTRAPAGAAKELLINSSSSSGGSEERGARSGEQETPCSVLPAPCASEEEVVIFLGKVRRALPAPLRLERAVRTALAAGVSLGELRARARWFAERQFDWPAEHRPGVLYSGLAEAQPGQAAASGWPYKRR